MQARFDSFTLFLWQDSRRCAGDPVPTPHSRRKRLSVYKRILLTTSNEKHTVCYSAPLSLGGHGCRPSPGRFGFSTATTRPGPSRSSPQRDLHLHEWGTLRQTPQPFKSFSSLKFLTLFSENAPEIEKHKGSKRKEGFYTDIS